MRLRLDLPPSRYAPGDVVRGRVRVEEPGETRGLDVSLRYIEESPDYKTVIRELSGAVLHTGALLAGQSIEFYVQLPDEPLLSVATDHSSLRWEVDARSDERGRRARAGADRRGGPEPPLR